MTRSDDPAVLRAEAEGGRIAHSGFLGPADSSRLAARLRGEGVAVTVTGGFPGARRRVVTAHPRHVPEAAPALAAVYLGAVSAETLRDAARAAGVPDAELGDAVGHQDGASLVTFDPPPAALLTPLPRAAGRAPEPVPLERVAAGTVRRDRIIVPSLRVDALGAKAFRTSRSWFTKGIKSGNVYLNGEPADKGSQADVGDEVFADGLGWLTVLAVTGETKKGNAKVEVEVVKG